MRVVTGGISHETSTFTPVPTTLQSYRDRFYLHGDELLSTFRGTNSPIGGFIDGAAQHGFELIPTVLATAQPSGPTPRDVFDTILDQLLGGIADAGAIDGVLLSLHGSMVVGDLDAPDGLDDPEGHILTAIRELVGPDVPILSQLDIHSNVSPQMVEMADVLIGRESYPEVDMADRSRECADVLMRIHNDGVRPTMALHQIPMFWGMNQVTAYSPMREAIAELHRIEGEPGVVCGSIATCYYLADVPHMGASVYIVTDNDQPLAQSYADQLGEWLFERRADWHYPIPSIHEALKTAEAEGKYPVIFADRNDNTGGGSPGDSTGVLEAFIEAGLDNACILYIVDAEAIAACHKAGVGATLTLDVGGKSTPLQGHPIRMTAEVVAVSDGSFRYDGPMYEGLEGSMGPSAHIKQDGIHVLLVTYREQPFDTAFSRTLGLDPREMRYISVKSTAHFRAGFEAWVQIYTGHEKKVKLNLDNMIAREELQDEILQVNVPETEVVEVKDSQRKVSVRPSYPGYVLVNTTHELGPQVESPIGQKSWALIQETPGVMNFLGPTSHPSPLSPTDVEAMLQMSTEEEEVAPVPAMEYEVGDKVKVINGPFNGFPGEIEEIDMEHQRLRLSISLFGRSTSVDLGLLEVEELN